MKKSKTSEVIENFAAKRKRAEDLSDSRCLEVYAVAPEVKTIDRELHSTALNVLTISSDGVDIEERIAALRERNESLIAKRRELLTKAGFPADYTDVKFECTKCCDTGFVGTKVCDCLRREIALAAIEDSGLGNLAKTQSFDNFDFDYYSGDARRLVERNFATLKDFAENFDPDAPKNFILLGATGLGKTHLSTSVAKTVIDRGYRVVYDTIDGIIADFSAARFKDTISDDEIKERYYNSDLLIIDDLGCEMANQFSISCVYNLINTRINANKSTIINTNLSYDELRGTYADRITSRLFGEFSPLVFKGTDIRRQKLEEK